jgi:hypothetical protein
MPVKLKAWPKPKFRRVRWLEALPADMWKPSEHGNGLLAGVDYPAKTGLTTIRAALRRYGKSHGIHLETFRMTDDAGVVIGCAVRVIPQEEKHRMQLLGLAKKQLAKTAEQ